eukprot:m.19509 g.19509  ORF g.19509 m.19509 type:complete len:213 (-) comp10915_c0_seq1:82-720(-)
MHGKRVCEAVSAGAPSSKRPSHNEACVNAAATAAASYAASMMTSMPFGMQPVLMWQQMQQMQLQMQHQLYQQQQLQQWQESMASAAADGARAKALAAALISHAARTQAASKSQDSQANMVADATIASPEAVDECDDTQEAEPLTPDESKENMMDDAAAAMALASLSRGNSDSTLVIESSLDQGKLDRQPETHRTALESILNCPLLNRDCAQA